MLVYIIPSVLLILENTYSLCCFSICTYFCHFHHVNLMCINKSKFIWEYLMDDVKMHLCISA